MRAVQACDSRSPHSRMKSIRGTCFSVFAFRLIVLTVFASLGTSGFRPAFAALLAMAALFCAIAGAMRREQMFGHVLTHWDEAVAYAVIARLASTLS